MFSQLREIVRNPFFLRPPLVPSLRGPSTAALSQASVGQRRLVLPFFWTSTPFEIGPFHLTALIFHIRTNLDLQSLLLPCHSISPSSVFFMTPRLDFSFPFFLRMILALHQLCRRFLCSSSSPPSQEESISPVVVLSLNDLPDRPLAFFAAVPKAASHCVGKYYGPIWSSPPSRVPYEGS